MDWPHAPVHRPLPGGTHIVTCGTYMKEHFFRGDERLSMLTESLLSVAAQEGWRLQAWAVFSNHYHIIVAAPQSGPGLARLLGHLHTVTAKAVNLVDEQPGRKVWFQYWDTALTIERSFLARLNYVHNNPVKHGLVEVASDYPWCSAAWFERTAAPGFHRTVSSFKTDRLNVQDDFTPDWRP